MTKTEELLPHHIQMWSFSSQTLSFGNIHSKKILSGRRISSKEKLSIDPRNIYIFLISLIISISKRKWLAVLHCIKYHGMLDNWKSWTQAISSTPTFPFWQKWLNYESKYCMSRFLGRPESESEATDLWAKIIPVAK